MRGFNESNTPPHHKLRISYVPDPQYFTCINHLILTTAPRGHCYDSPIVQRKLGGFTAIKQRNEVKVAQSHPTLCNPMDYTVQRILQARILEWVAIPSSRGSSQPRDQTQVSPLQVDSLPAEPPGKPIKRRNWASNLRRLKGRATSLKKKKIWWVQRQAALLLRRLQGNLKSSKPSTDLVFYRYVIDVAHDGWFSIEWKSCPWLMIFNCGGQLCPQS